MATAWVGRPGDAPHPVADGTTVRWGDAKVWPNRDDMGVQQDSHLVALHVMDHLLLALQFLRVVN